jgi:adenylate cyclase
MVRAEGVAAAERAAGTVPGARPMGVAFADLVGFTRLGEQLPPEELTGVADRLADIAGQLATQPVRMVKTIGDAAMLVCDEDEPLVAVALALVEAVDAEGADFPQVRVGLARGPATQSGGDWFGRPVNLASRITTVARTGSVLAAEEVHDGASEAFAWSFAGERKLKGISAPVKLFRARRLASEAT